MAGVIGAVRAGLRQLHLGKGRRPAEEARRNRRASALLPLASPPPRGEVAPLAKLAGREKGAGSAEPIQLRAVRGAGVQSAAQGISPRLCRCSITRADLLSLP